VVLIVVAVLQLFIWKPTNIYIYIYTYICIYVCIYVYVCIYIYIYILLFFTCEYKVNVTFYPQTQLLLVLVELLLVVINKLAVNSVVKK